MDARTEGPKKHRRILTTQIGSDRTRNKKVILNNYVSPKNEIGKTELEIIKR